MSTETCWDIIRVKEVVFGNGSKGLTTLVDEHEIYIQQQKGSFGTIKWILGFVGLSNIAIIIKMFLK